MKYSDALIGWLKSSGYTHCYFVAGGNIMHLLNSARQFLVCIPVVHEVAAVIATEYHNATFAAGSSAPGIGKALAMVTAGPGLTNAITGVAGAWLESRELLLLGGQVKVEDLAPPGLRQLGIQEVNGVALAAPVCKRSIRLNRPIESPDFLAEVASSWQGRPGPVFIELPLDVQAVQVPDSWRDLSEVSNQIIPLTPPTKNDALDRSLVAAVSAQIAAAERPVLLLGGGLSRPMAQRLEPLLAALSLPVMTTWNGADRYSSDHPNYAGRPNTWGMRFSNLIIQQADLLVAVGSRLGLQQTGFNWRQFVPVGTVIQVDIDDIELAKANPLVSDAINADADSFLDALLLHSLGQHDEWLAYSKKLRSMLPVSEACNKTPEGYINPYDMVLTLSEISCEGDHIVPCSSGGAFTVMMQAFALRRNQTMLTNKGLASMGYGLSGAIGVSIADPNHRTILVEGDGGFSQNLQELATVAVNRLNIKMFLFCNQGYASIRMTQKNYFDGAYLGCDTETGLGFPNWFKLADSYGIQCLELGNSWNNELQFNSLWNSKNPVLFLVPVHPDQTYFPKISSRINPNGGMESSPLHLMTPSLSPGLQAEAFRYLPENLR